MASFTRRFSVPAGTMLADASGKLTALPVQTFTATREGATKSAAQKAALREAAVVASGLLGRKVSQRELQTATSAPNYETGRARGGRTPKAASGLAKREPSTAGWGKAAAKAPGGFQTYALGTPHHNNDKPKFIKNPHAQLRKLFAVINRTADDLRTARITIQYHAPEDQQTEDQRRYFRRRYPVDDEGATKHDVSPYQWTSTETFMAARFAVIFPNPESLEYGVTYTSKSEATDWNGVDAAKIVHMTVVVKDAADA